MRDGGGCEGLAPCVLCGFCLQACPTFLAPGDESDSPRGRIELMRALGVGELTPADPGVALHLDRCLGCRGCEPVCPSGVAYGRGLEAARALLTERRGVPPLVRAALGALTGAGAPVVYALARVLRATGIPSRLAGWGRIRFALGMLAATKPVRNAEFGMRNRSPRVNSAFRTPHSALTPVTLFRGCVMEGLFSHVHDATIRTLQVNGYAVREVPTQVCCGALHAHAGLRDEARRLAGTNIAAFGDDDTPIVVNSAGCGAMLKEYGHLVAVRGRGETFAARVRDVSELLAERGPRPGAPLDVTVAYDPPCHLMHAQRIAGPPERMLGAIPRAVLAPKLASLAAARPQVVATGNPGCLMQLGAGLAAAGVPAAVRHPVELLDESYRAAGYYA